MLSIPEAADRLGIHPGRVRQLVVNGRLAGQKVGGRWLVDADCVEARAASQPPAGRLLSPRGAWGLLWTASGREAPWLSAREIRRARDRAASWSLEHWAWACQHRATAHRFYGHPSVLTRLADDGRLMRSGVSVRNTRIDLLEFEQVECYVRAESLPAIVDDFGLHDAARANVILRVPHDGLTVLDEGQDAPWPVVAVDLFDAGDDRSVRAARSLFGREGS